MKKVWLGIQGDRTPGATAGIGTAYQVREIDWPIYAGGHARINTSTGAMGAGTEHLSLAK